MRYRSFQQNSWNRQPVEKARETWLISGPVLTLWNRKRGQVDFGPNTPEWLDVKHCCSDKSGTRNTQNAARWPPPRCRWAGLPHSGGRWFPWRTVRQPRYHVGLGRGRRRPHISPGGKGADSIDINSNEGNQRNFERKNTLVLSYRYARVLVHCRTVFLGWN